AAPSGGGILGRRGSWSVAPLGVRKSPGQEGPQGAVQDQEHEQPGQVDQRPPQHPAGPPAAPPPARPPPPTPTPPPPPTPPPTPTGPPRSGGRAAASSTGPGLPGSGARQ